jgi:predicted MFS family arabinose efflux permease
MAAGWTLGSIASSGATPGRARAALTVGPVALAAGLAVLGLLMPAAGPPTFALLPIGGGLLGMGFGIGVTWPHLGTRVFAFTADADRELAGASITMVVMAGNAFGAALGGMVTNLGGLLVPGGQAGAASASAWLFSGFVLSPLLAALAIRRLPAQARRVPAQ